MEWKTHVRLVGSSRYIALPPDYCRAKKIEREQIAVFTLNPDGSLNIRVRDPVMNFE